MKVKNTQVWFDEFQTFGVKIVNKDAFMCQIDLCMEWAPVFLEDALEAIKEFNLLKLSPEVAEDYA